jgi:sucrose phosphorylase
MRVLSEGRSDLVILQRGEGPGTLFAIHNFSDVRLSFPFEHPYERHWVCLA